MNETTRYDLFNPQVAFVDDTDLRSAPFYKIKALAAVTFTVFGKTKCSLDGLDDSKTDMSGISLAAGEEITVNFSSVQLAGGSALLYAAGARTI